MATSRDVVLAAISAERDRQTAIGTDAKDQGTFTNDFIAYAIAYLGRAATGVYRNEQEGQVPKRNLIKAAAILVAALEQQDLP